MSDASAVCTFQITKKVKHSVRQPEEHTLTPEESDRARSRARHTSDLRQQEALKGVDLQTHMKEMITDQQTIHANVPDDAEFWKLAYGRSPSPRQPDPDTLQQLSTCDWLDESKQVKCLRERFRNGYQYS